MEETIEEIKNQHFYELQGWKRGSREIGANLFLKYNTITLKTSVNHETESQLLEYAIANYSYQMSCPREI